MQRTMIGMAFLLALGFGSAAVQAQTWKPPGDSDRCPSKWGAKDKRGSANHMKPDLSSRPRSSSRQVR